MSYRIKLWQLDDLLGAEHEHGGAMVISLSDKHREVKRRTEACPVCRAVAEAYETGWTDRDDQACCEAVLEQHIT